MAESEPNGGVARREVLAVLAAAVLLVGCDALTSEGIACRHQEPSLLDEAVARGATGMGAASGYTCDDPELFCDTAGGRNICERPRAAGGACADDTHCREELFCDLALARCAAPRAAGGACTSPEHCVDPLVCMEGRCAPLRALAESCGDSFPCGAQLVCLDGRCSAGRTLDQACDGVERCAPGLVCHVERCVRGGVAGDPCGPGAPCDYAFGCRAGRCAE